MGLRLISDDERLVYEGDGFEIFYRRIPSGTRGRIINKHTKRGGETNWAKATEEMLEHCITGWAGVYTTDADGIRTDEPFSSDKIRMIPDDVQIKLVDLVGANADAEDVEAGNLSTISSSSTITTDSRATNAGSKPMKTKST